MPAVPVPSPAVVDVEDVPAVRLQEALSGAIARPGDWVRNSPVNFGGGGGGARPRVPAEFYVPEFSPQPPARRRRQGISIVIL